LALASKGSRAHATAPPSARIVTRDGRGPRDKGWHSLFETAFRRSRNAMVLADGQRVQVDVNSAYAQLLGRRPSELIGRHLYEFVKGGPILKDDEWRDLMFKDEFAGDACLLTNSGAPVLVHFAGHPEIVTGRRLVLFVALTTSRAGRHLRRQVDHEPDDDKELSDRELEICRLIALGESGPEIAEQLHITHNTVRTHVRNAMEKTGARSRAHLVAKALGSGLVLN
jgi:DNA-binding CsgD family transcriptional regulator